MGLLILISGLLGSTSYALDLSVLKLPPGFKIEVLASVPNAREMAVAPSGNIYVGSRDAGKVYAIIRKNLKTVRVVTLVSGERMPVGVAFADGDLYYSAVDKIKKLKAIESHLVTPPVPSIVSAAFPSDGHHGWKYIAFGPDKKLYVPVGAPCNICEPGDKYANIMRMDKDGSNLELYARGIRNTVGFDWHPKTHEMWFTDNGRDLLGEDIPPDELNSARKAGMNFGYPYCHGLAILDPEYGKGRSCDDYTAPKQELGPHVAALGMTFYDGKMFPPSYHGQIFIAEHGSWNRSKKIGYRVSLVELKNDKVVKYSTFVEGWLQGESAWGRPADVKVDRDGALLVADDEAGVIYRVYYTPPK